MSSSEVDAYRVVGRICIFREKLIADALEIKRGPEGMRPQDAEVEANIQGSERLPIPIDGTEISVRRSKKTPAIRRCNDQRSGEQIVVRRVSC